MPPEPPWARPPKQGSLGWIWALGKTAHFSGTQALPPVIPHEGTKLGPSQRWGMGWPYQTHTHTRTGSETKGKRKGSAYSLEAAQSQSLSPWSVGQCLKLKAPPLDLKGGKPLAVAKGGLNPLCSQLSAILVRLGSLNCAKLSALKNCPRILNQN